MWLIWFKGLLFSKKALNSWEILVSEAIFFQKTPAVARAAFRAGLSSNDDVSNGRFLEREN